MTALPKRFHRSHLHERDVDLLADDQFATKFHELTPKQQAATREHIDAEVERINDIGDRLHSIRLILDQPVYPEPDTTPPPAEAAPDGEPNP